jgi:DNA-binding response OmpR family regulator
MDVRRRRTDGARILVVEDHEDFCALLELTLRDAGYEVDCASSSEDALAMLRIETYALVISDYSLPGHSGAWLVAQARESTGVPALIVTGDPDAAGIPRNVPVMRKPFDVDRLVEQVRALVGGAQPSARVRSMRNSRETMGRAVTSRSHASPGFDVESVS